MRVAELDTDAEVVVVSDALCEKDAEVSVEMESESVSDGATVTVDDVVGEDDKESLDETVSVIELLRVSVTDADVDLDPSTVAVCELDVDIVADNDSVADVVTELVSVTVSENDGVAEMLSVGDGVCVDVYDAVTVVLSLTLSETVADLLNACDTVREYVENEALSVMEYDMVTLNVGDVDTVVLVEADLLSEDVPLGETDPVDDGVTEADNDKLADVVTLTVTVDETLVVTVSEVEEVCVPE